MTRRFLEFIPFIFKWEGGYDNDPDDPGGETKFGIDKRSHPNVDIKNLTREQATEIYWREYWVRNGCEWLPGPLGEVFFNACVNCGADRAKKLLKGLLGSRSALAYLDAQEAFYRRLVAGRLQSRAEHAKDKKWLADHSDLSKFLKGWLNRIRDLRHWVSSEKTQAA